MVVIKQWGCTEIFNFALLVWDYHEKENYNTAVYLNDYTENLKILNNINVCKKKNKTKIQVKWGCGALWFYNSDSRLNRKRKVNHNKCDNNMIIKINKAQTEIKCIYCQAAKTESIRDDSLASTF